MMTSYLKGYGIFLELLSRALLWEILLDRVENKNDNGHFKVKFDRNADLEVHIRSSPKINQLSAMVQSPYPPNVKPLQTKLLEN